MKFITYNENYEVQLIHNMPFDKVNGLGKTKEELLKIGALVEDIPTVEVPINKKVVYKYNPDTNTVTCELVDKPLTIEEQNSIAIKELINTNKSMEDVINACLLAIAELHKSIPALSFINSIDEDNESKINDIYEYIAQKGLK